MKLKNIDKILPGEVVVFVRTSGIKCPSIKEGDEYVFHKFYKMEPISASQIYLLKKDSTNDLRCFSTSVCKNIETKQKLREKKLNELFK